MFASSYSCQSLRIGNGLKTTGTVLHAILRAGTLFACILSLYGAALGDNIAPNPGFESGDGKNPSEWNFHSWEKSVGWWEQKMRFSGKKAIGMSGINGGWRTTVSVREKSLYRLSLRYRADGENLRIQIFIKKPGKEGGILFKMVPAIQHDSQGYFIEGLYVGGADKNGWVFLDGGEFKTPEGTTTAELLIKITGTDSESKLLLDDIRLEELKQRIIPDTARLLAITPGGKVWTDSENAKITPERKPPETPAVSGIKLSAAGGEYESFQIAVTPKDGWTKAQWQWSDFIGPSQLPASNLRSRLLEVIPISQPFGYHGHQGLNPDPLTERLPCDIPAGRNQAFWFTLRIPDTQMPGLYSTTLLLQTDGKTISSIPLSVHVRGFRVPAKSSLEVVSSSRFDLVCQRETGDRDEIVRRYYRNYAEHRSRCRADSRIKAIIKNDSVSVSMDDFLSDLRYLRDTHAFERVHLPVLWIDHNNKHTMPPDASWYGIPIFGNADLTALSPEFTRLFGDFLRQVTATLASNDLFHSVVVKFFDEPYFSDQRTVNGMRAIAELMLKIAPSLIIDTAAVYPHPKLIDVIRSWNLHTDGWEQNLADIEAARKAGCEIHVYNNAVNFPEHRPLRVRLWPWLLYKYRVDGTLSWWGMDCWRDEFVDPWNGGKGSSGILFYPPRSSEEHGPIDSVRWELFREGLEDYEYLRLAENEIARLETAGKREAAKRGRDAVANALGLVEKWPNVQSGNDEPYTLDPALVSAARMKLADAIEEMMKLR